MKSFSWCLAAAAAALLWALQAAAETEAEYGQGPHTRGAGPKPAVPRPAPAARPGAFAPNSVATARRLAPYEREERLFLKEAAAAIRFHADAARLATTRSGNQAVRSLAATFVQQQSTSGNELLRMLHQRGMAEPMLQNDQRKVLNRLGKLQGHRFEREFIEAVAVRSQQEMIALCDKATLAVQDPALADWIARAMPTLRSQLASAQRLASGDSGVTRPRPPSRPALP